MKEFWYKSLSEYIEMADQYHDPKVIKMFQVKEVENKRIFVAITYLRTTILGHKEEIRDNAHEQDLKNKVLGHAHKEGEMREVAPLKL